MRTEVLWRKLKKTQGSGNNRYKGGNYVTLNSIMHTADEAFSVTVITVRRGKILGQVRQQIFLQSVHTACGIHRASYLVRTVDFFAGEGGKVADTCS